MEVIVKNARTRKQNARTRKQHELDKERRGSRVRERERIGELETEGRGSKVRVREGVAELEASSAQQGTHLQRVQGHRTLREMLELETRKRIPAPANILQALPGSAVRKLQALEAPRRLQTDVRRQLFLA